MATLDEFCDALQFRRLGDVYVSGLGPTFKGDIAILLCRNGDYPPVGDNRIEVTVPRAALDVFKTGREARAYVAFLAKVAP